MSNSTITLNSSNITNTTTNNVLKYKFPNTITFTGKEQIALASFSCYYSWFNVNAQAYNNNTYSYTWIDGTTYPVVMPNMNASVAVLNAYLQSVMVANGTYLIDVASGNYLYYIQFVENAVFYSVELLCYATPTSLGSQYAYPSGATWTLGSGNCPQVNFYDSSVSNFNLLVGFTAGATYPPLPQTITYSINSTIIPEINPVSALILTCNVISNRYTANNQTLYATGIPSVDFGQEIVCPVYQFAYNKINQSTQLFIEIQITDQNGNAVYFNDPQITILLTISEGI
jgi:hypothetical protein